MDLVLAYIDWCSYLKLTPESLKVTGYPVYCTINPDTNVCIIWPSPAENVEIIARIKE